MTKFNQPLTANQVSLTKAITGTDRKYTLKNKVYLYITPHIGVWGEVEDIMADELAVCFKDDTGATHVGMVFIGDVGIVFDKKKRETEGNFSAYRSYVLGLESEVQPFKTGLEIKLSPAVASSIKELGLKFKSKGAATAALFGKKKLFGREVEKSAPAVNKAGVKHSSVEQIESDGFNCQVDEELALRVLKFVNAVGDEIFRVIAGVAALADFSGFKAKLKVLDQDIKDRENELKD